MPLSHFPIQTILRKIFAPRRDIGGMLHDSMQCKTVCKQFYNSSLSRHWQEIFERADLMKNRKYYRKRFAKYPDVVTIPQFCEMLGGISDKTARKLLRENRVKHYYIRTTFYIPKEWVIDYILSADYAKYRSKLRVQV